MNEKSPSPTPNPPAHAWFSYKTRPGKLLLLGVAFCGIVYSWVGDFDLHVHADSACPSVVVLGLACPGCGGTRAFILALRGEFGESLMMNPLGMVAFLGLLYGLVCIVRDLRDGEHRLEHFFAQINRQAERFIWLILPAVLALWAWNLSKFSGIELF